MDENLTKIVFLTLRLWQWLALFGAAAVAWVAGMLLGHLTIAIVSRFIKNTEGKWDEHLLQRLASPIRLLTGLVAFRGLLMFVKPNRAATEIIVDGWRTLTILAGIWCTHRLIDFAALALTSNATTLAHKDVYAERGVRTNVSLIRRLLLVSNTIIGAALVSLQFEAIRNLGVSLLASAGIAGIVVGFAAQRTLGTLLAGIQLSITQPIRIGDTVVIENETGVVEEIALTFAVVRAWDNRRFIVPVTRFLEHTFQNWTKSQSDLFGAVEIFADYTVPVERVREAFLSYIESNPRWNNRKAALTVASANERSVALRAIVSANSPDELGDLRTDVREYLMGVLQRLDEGAYLVRHRVEDSRADVGKRT